MLSFFVAAGKLNTFKLKNKDLITKCAVYLKLSQRPQSSTNYCLVLLSALKNLAYCSNPAGSFLLKQQIWFKLIVKTPKQSCCRRLGVFIVNFDHFLHIALVFPLLTLFFMKSFVGLLQYLVTEYNFKGRKWKMTLRNCGYELVNFEWFTLTFHLLPPFKWSMINVFYTVIHHDNKNI